MATDLSQVVRTMGWIVAADVMYLNKKKKHTGKRLSLQNLSSTPLHFYVCINSENNRNYLFFILPSSHVAGEHISKTCTVHCAHCIIMYLYKEVYSSAFCSSLQGELNHTVSC